MRSRTVILLATLGLMLATAGCGARLTDEQYQAAVGSGGGSGGSTNRTASGTGTNTAGASNTAGVVTGGTEGSQGTQGTEGTSGNSGDTGQSAGAAACAKTAGHTAPGLDDNKIRIGNVSAISGLVQNFGATSRDGAKAYIEYVNNELGGVCGRMLELVPADDGLDPGRNRDQTAQLKDQVFLFAASLSGEDDGGAAIKETEGIPDCSQPIGANARKSPVNFAPNPVDPTLSTNGTVPIWNYFKANHGITKVAIVYQDNPNAKANVPPYENDILAAGLGIVQPGGIPVPVIGANYDTTAAQMKSAGADSVITVMEINAVAGLARAVKKLDGGTWLKVPYWGAQVYGPDFAKLAGDAAEGALIGVTHDIVEAPTAPATSKFQEWYAAVTGGKAPDFFAITGWAATQFCVNGILAAGGAPTREAVLNALRTAGTFDADGLVSPRDPGAKIGPTTFKIITMQGGQWANHYPASGYASG